jgi:repressor LexA
MRDKKDVSSKGEEILLFIERYSRKNGYPPTVREIGEAVGLASSCSVHYHLRKLEEKGLIRRIPSKPRAIELNAHQIDAQLGEAVIVPFVEDFTLSKRGVDVGQVRQFFLFSRSLLEGEECFVLRVNRDGFRAWHILEGDYLVVNKRETGQAGDLMLVWEDEGVGIRKVGEDGKLLTGKEEPLSPSWSMVAVIGKIVGIWRKL